MALPTFLGTNALQLLQDRWSSILDPVIDNPANKSSLLKDVRLATGSNTVNHLLARKLQGWSIVRINAAATVYDQQDANPTPNATLILVSSAPCTVTLSVF